MNEEPTPTRIRRTLRGLDSLTGTPPAFDLDALPAEPAELFEEWLDNAIARGVPEPHAMTLSTVDAQGFPDARVLILKDVTHDGCWSFASSVASAKGRQLAENNAAALTFYWSPVVRSVRIRGLVTEASPSECARDFRRRGASARAVVLGGTQSAPISMTDDVGALIAEARHQLNGAVLDGTVPGAAPLPNTGDWRLWRLRPTSIEFWQGSPDRQHVRVRYSRGDSGWTTERLWP